MTERCAAGHHWVVVREVKAIETYDVSTITNGEDKEVDPLVFWGDLYPVVTHDSGDLDVTEVCDEYLGCKYCCVEARGDRIQAVVYKYESLTPP